MTGGDSLLSGASEAAAYFLFSGATGGVSFLLWNTSNDGQYQSQKQATTIPACLPIFAICFFYLETIVTSLFTLMGFVLLESFVPSKGVVYFFSLLSPNSKKNLIHCLLVLCDFLLG